MSKVSNVLCKFLFGFGNVLMVLFAALTILAGASTLWVLKTWPHLTMQELMFTI